MHSVSSKVSCVKSVINEKRSKKHRNNKKKAEQIHQTVYEISLHKRSSVILRESLDGIVEDASDGVFSDSTVSEGL